MEFVDIILYIGYGLVILAGVGSIVLPLINSLSNPKSLLKSLIGIVAIGVIYLISWAVAGNEVTAVYTKFGITSTSSQVIGGVLITTYFLLGAAIVMVLISMLSRAFK